MTPEFRVTVRDHMMVAHSLHGAVFGPAQHLHGATFIVDATFVAHDLDRSGIVVDIGCAAEQLHTVLADLNYHNLDDEEALAGVNTSTEALARVIADRLADRARSGLLGRPEKELTGIEVTLRESHIAWASYARPL